MYRSLYKFQLDSNTIFFLMLFSMSSFFVGGQNITIAIKDSLSDKAEKYNIQSVKLKKLRFGEYSVVKARPGWITSTTHTTHKTYEENISHQKISFILVKGKTAYVQIEATFSKISQYRQSGGFLFQALTGIESGNYESLNNSSNLSASISTNNDKIKPWNLLLEETPIDGGETLIEGSLGNGVRTIYIKLVSVGKFDYDVEFIDVSPLRYEFTENEQSLGAMQVANQNYATSFLFKANLEPTIQMILAASMTLIRYTEYGLRFEPLRK